MEDRYEIKEKIGQGGIGTVHRGYDHRMQREVAIKRILTSQEDPTLEGEATKQLLVEAAALASLQHPHIVTVFDVGQDEKGPYVVMELINGLSLDEIIEKGPLTWEDFKQVAMQSQEALLAAQELGMIHSDLKPPNIMLTWLPSGTFQVKIVDFGLAMLIQNQSKEEIEKLESIFGSIFFMPPEQFERQTLDERSDLYSIGCVYYQALTCSYPFSGETGADVMNAHLNHTVTPLQELRDDIPAWACEWVMWLINRDREHRPQTSREALANFLKNDLNSNPVMSSGGGGGKTKPMRQLKASQFTGVPPRTTGPHAPGVQTSTARTQAQPPQSADTARKYLPTPGPAKPGFLMDKRRIVIPAAAIVLFGILTWTLVKRNQRVTADRAYASIVNIATGEQMIDIPMDAKKLQIVLGKVANSAANSDISTPLKALVLAKASDGTDIDIVIAKFATGAKMHANIRQKLFDQVIVERRSASVIPIIAAYAEKTGIGLETLTRLHQMNEARQAPAPAQPVLAATASPRPQPEPSLSPQNSGVTKVSLSPDEIGQVRRPQKQTTEEDRKVIENAITTFEGNDESLKIETIALLARSNNPSAHQSLLAASSNGRNPHLHTKVILTVAAFNSQRFMLENSKQAGQRWTQISRRARNYEQEEAVILALKEIDHDWAESLLLEFTQNPRRTPEAAKLADKILKERQP